VAGQDAVNHIRPTESASSHAHEKLILRMWKARSTIEKSDHYIQHATTRVFPALEAIDGHRRIKIGPDRRSSG
jgi:hypothetical protein